MPVITDADEEQFCEARLYIGCLTPNNEKFRCEKWLQYKLLAILGYIQLV